MSGLEGVEMQKPWFVLEFGGVSVARAERWGHDPREAAAEVVLDR